VVGKATLERKGDGHTVILPNKGDMSLVRKGRERIRGTSRGSEDCDWGRGWGGDLAGWGRLLEVDLDFYICIGFE
jgi:hypothetical protein